MKLRLQLFTLDPKAKKRHTELAEDESDLDEDFMERHEADLLEKALESAQKKFDKDNIKLEDQQEAKLPKSELDDKLKAIKAEFKELRKERKSRQVEPRKGGKCIMILALERFWWSVTEDKLLQQITKMDERIATAKVQMSDRDNLKDVALGTSK
jgi:DNA topoisomerase-1